MNRTASFVLAGVLAVSLGACKKHEHPEEHPTQEQPDQPSGKVFDLKKEYTTAVNTHINVQIKNSGAFNVFDAKLKKEWGMSLVRIHSDKIVGLGSNRYFACADLKDAKTGKMLDLDFYATKKPSGWEIEPALIHKIEGKRRYTYDANNNRVPLKG